MARDAVKLAPGLQCPESTVGGHTVGVKKLEVQPRPRVDTYYSIQVGSSVLLAVITLGIVVYSNLRFFESRCGVANRFKLKYVVGFLALVRN